jgi:hypothetical protein
VFTTAARTARDKDNVRSKCSSRLWPTPTSCSCRGREPVAPGVTAYKLRHTFASLLTPLGEDPATVMSQLATPTQSSRSVYAHMMRRGDDERVRLRALVEGCVVGIEELHVVFDDEEGVTVEGSLDEQDRVLGAGSANRERRADEPRPLVAGRDDDAGLEDRLARLVGERATRDNSPDGEVHAADHMPDDDTQRALLGTENEEGLPEEAEIADGRGGFRTCDLSRVKRALSH